MTGHDFLIRLFHKKIAAQRDLLTAIRPQTRLYPSQLIQLLPYHIFPEKEPTSGWFLQGQLCHFVAKKEETPHAPAEVPASTPFWQSSVDTVQPLPTPSHINSEIKFFLPPHCLHQGSLSEH